ncbi:unnamed protein product, partial [Ectocarpus sp. 12 AP-2014]
MYAATTRAFNSELVDGRHVFAGSHGALADFPAITKRIPAITKRTPAITKRIQEEVFELLEQAVVELRSREPVPTREEDKARPWSRTAQDVPAATRNVDRENGFDDSDGE